ncbi:MAG: hypothetical protein K1X35_05590 [Caulobacteraceae bacterium]|nr:hypothetical protein [Caulobacteraceae bacterium]
MRFPQAAHMPDDGHGDHGHHAQPAASSHGGSSDTPVWARRSSKGAGGGGLFMFIFMLFALLGGLFIVLRVMDHSFEAAGHRVDGWVKPAFDQVAKMTGKAGDKAEEAADDAAAAAGDAAQAAGDAAESAGDAAQAATAQPATPAADAPAKK